MSRSSPAQLLAGDKCKKIPAYALLNTDKHLCAGESDGKKYASLLSVDIKILCYVHY